VDIVTGLPEFFTPDVLDKVRADLLAHNRWALVEDDTVAAFANRCSPDRRDRRDLV